MNMLKLFQILLSVSFYLDLTHGFVPNSAWKSVLSCRTPFPVQPDYPEPDKGRKDPIFAGRLISCHPPPPSDRHHAKVVATYVEHLERSGDLDIAPFLILVVLIVGVGLYVGPAMQAKYREGHYVMVVSG